MLKVSLAFAAIGLVCLGLADIAVTTLDPWAEIGRLAAGAVRPDFGALYSFRTALLNTLTFAFCGTALGAGLGGGLAFFFGWTPVRLCCAFVRSIHEIFWAFLFLPLVGLNPVCGILAIAIPYAGIFAKVYAEILQEADPRPLRGLPPTAGRLSRFLYGVLPAVYAEAAHYTAYRFECALRSSAVLGFIGLPTLGFHLETAFREGLYGQAAVLLYVFYLVIASLKYWLKARYVGLYVGISFVLVSGETALSWGQALRFLTYEILPWPLRRQGVAEGTQAVSLPWGALWEWAENLLNAEVLPGVWHTVVLTQIALVATGVLTLAGFALVSRHFFGPAIRRLARYGLVVVRTTPEYLLAYVFVLLWGPSMLPAIVAIALHNAAILAHLLGQQADRFDLRLDAPGRRAERYFFEVLPRLYGRFLALLFYRWETILRESALLGVLGIYTLGFYIDSAIADDRLDRAVLLILCTGGLNMVVDGLSQRLRRGMRLSAGRVRALAS